MSKDVEDTLYCASTLHVNSLTPEEPLLLFICCHRPANYQLLLTANNQNATVYICVWALCVLCAVVACQTL